MREIERRLRKLEDVGPTRRDERFAISDSPDDELEDDRQVRHSMDGGRVIYLLEERVLSVQDGAKKCCTPD
jgi:hypothetical protein